VAKFRSFGDSTSNGVEDKLKSILSSCRLIKYRSELHKSFKDEWCSVVVWSMVLYGYIVGHKLLKRKNIVCAISFTQKYLTVFHGSKYLQ